MSKNIHYIDYQEKMEKKTDEMRKIGNFKVHI